MASVVKGLGRGGARQAQIQLGWDRITLRKGLRELNSGIVCVDAVSQRGRKPLEASLSNLEADLRAMGEATSQTDPTFRTTQLYRRLTAGEARRRLVEEMGYAPAEVPSERIYGASSVRWGSSCGGWPRLDYAIKRLKNRSKIRLKYEDKMERAKGFEPSTLTLAT